MKSAGGALENNSDTSGSSHPEYSSESSDQEGSTPTRAYEREECSTINRRNNKPSVKELVGYFSQSDSETAAVERTTRRKSSKNLEHKELPPGGERELKRNIKMQEAAAKAMKTWETLNRELIEDLNEAQKSLDANHSKGVLKGHLAGLSSAVAYAQEALKAVMTYEEKSDVAIDFEQIRMQARKSEKNPQKSKSSFRRKY